MLNVKRTDFMAGGVCVCVTGRGRALGFCYVAAIQRGTAAFALRF